VYTELREVLEPLLKEIEALNERIKEYDARMEKIAKESYPQVALLGRSHLISAVELGCSGLFFLSFLVCSFSFLPVFL
jgi:hypothetical protein